jgi:hypothetical protein
MALPGVRAEANRVAKVLLLDIKVRYKQALGMTGNKPPAAIEAIDQAADRLAISGDPPRAIAAE